MPPQLEKNHVVPTSWQDEALARDGVSKEVPCSALKGETVPEVLPILFREEAKVFTWALWPSMTGLPDTLKSPSTALSLVYTLPATLPFSCYFTNI